MKKILIAVVFITASFVAFTQPPQPNPNGNHGNHNGHGNGHGNHNHNGAPIGSGTLILISLGVAYGVTKFVKTKKSLVN